MEMVALL